MKIYRVLTAERRFRYLASKEQARHEQAWINRRLKDGDHLDTLVIEIPDRMTRRAVCQVLNSELGAIQDAGTT
jgi:hypothetical protein